MRDERSCMRLAAWHHVKNWYCYMLLLLRKMAHFWATLMNSRPKVQMRARFLHFNFSRARVTRAKVDLYFSLSSMNFPLWYFHAHNKQQTTTHTNHRELKFGWLESWNWILVYEEASWIGLARSDSLSEQKGLLVEWVLCLAVPIGRVPGIGNCLWKPN